MGSFPSSGASRPTRRRGRTRGRGSPPAPGPLGRRRRARTSPASTVVPGAPRAQSAASSADRRSRAAIGRVVPGPGASRGQHLRRLDGVARLDEGCGTHGKPDPMHDAHATRSTPGGGSRFSASAMTRARLGDRRSASAAGWQAAGIEDDADRSAGRGAGSAESAVRARG